MRIRIDKDLTFTVLEADGARARYIVLFTVREEETGREYLVYTDDKVRAFRRDPVYGSRFRRDGEDLLLKAVETEEELDLDYCKESHSGEFAYALSNSLGFGGHNASILLGMRP